MDSKASTENPNRESSANRATPWDRLLSTKPRTSWNSSKSSSLAGRRVMITGAGGSIGSALAHAAAASLPASLILLDSSENGLYEVDRSLHEFGCQPPVSILGSVCDAQLVGHSLAEHQPDIIVHAAALKHVPLMERNPFAVIENNVFGTEVLINAAIAHKVQHLLLVSTDKAVDPCSIMGASKRIAELLVLSAYTCTHLIAVRLCNVIGSQGSVLPLFREQIAKGGPLTVTDPDAQRYFLTLEEAVNALLDALTYPSAQTLLLPATGPAVRIADLAQQALASQQSSAAVVFTGLRDGDKLVEQLLSPRESLSAAPPFGGAELRTINTPTVNVAHVSAALQILRTAIQSRDLPLLLRGVCSLVPEYQPSSLINAAPRKRPAFELASEMQP